MSVLEQLLAEKAGQIRECWFDVDGVQTPQGSLAIYDVSDDRMTCFKQEDGVASVCLRPCDMDGVPVSPAIEYFAGHVETKIMEGYRFDTRDGQVVKYLIQYGIPAYFISGRNSPCVRKRAKDLGATPFLGVSDKLATIRAHAQCDLKHVLFVGDGIQDCETLRSVGLGIAPADACLEAKASAHCVTIARGGEGVLNEILGHFLRIRGGYPE